MRNLPKEPDKQEIQPWHSFGNVEHICELPKTCMVLYGIFTEIARMVYQDREGRLIGTPDVLWTPKGTGLWIDSELRWEDQHPEVRPAIYVQLGQQESRPYFPALNGKVSSYDRFGERQYEQSVTGHVTFMHVASTSGEACALADNTEYAIKMLQDVICRDFCFTQFTVAGRVPLEKLPKEASDKYASGVTFAYEFADSWMLKRECPILKAVDFDDISSDKGGNNARRATVSRDNIVTEKKSSGKTSTN